MPTIRIMLVDDHGLMRQGLRAILQQEEGMVVIGEASSGEALLQQIENGACPDVVLMDAYLGGMSGVEATEQLKRIRPAVHVIGLAASDHAIVAMVQAGACSYLTKTAAASDLVKTIRAAYAQELDLMHRRPPVLPSPTTKPAVRHSPSATVPNLTKSQLAVLKLLIQGYSDNKIAQRLMMSEERVRWHLGYIFGALGVTNRKEVVMSAMTDRFLVAESHLLAFPGIELDEERHEVTVRGHVVNLSPTEYAVLYHLMSVPDQPVSKKELLSQIWHSNFERSTNLVEVTILRLRGKIEEDPAHPKHIVTMQRVGYKFSTKPETFTVHAASMQYQYNEAVVSG